jgi:glycosyltransferase involved in cell wall biosynthesis
MRLTLVIASMARGGAEQVLATLANRWEGMGRQVTLLTLDDGAHPPAVPLAPGIVHRPLGLAQGSRGLPAAVRQNLRRVRHLREAIQASAPAVVVSFMDQTNVLTLLATLGLKVPVIVAERNHPTLRPLGRSWRLLKRLTYPRATRLVVQTRHVVQEYPAALRERIHIIPNPVAPVATEPAEPAPQARRTVAAMGRLVPQKGFDLLLEAWGRLAGRWPDWRLEIWGEGEQRAALEHLREALGLQGSVTLPGRTDDPQAVFRRAAVFVLSSRYEGFPNVLGEAMACGVPPVSFDCRHGPGEILRDGIDGLLVPAEDVASLAASLERLIADPALRARLGTRAREITSRFGLSSVAERWEILLEEVVPRE